MREPIKALEHIKQDIINTWGSIQTYRLAGEINYFNRFYYLSWFERKGKIVKGHHSERLYEEQYRAELHKFMKKVSVNIRETDYTVIFYKNKNVKISFKNETIAELFMNYVKKVNGLVRTYSIHDQL